MKQKIIRGDKKSQEENCRRVVDYLKKKSKMTGHTHQKAALLFNLSKSGVDKIWLRYKNGENENALVANKRGARRGWKLSADQEAKIKHLINRKPSSGYELWSVDKVKSLVLKKCKVNLSRSQVSRYLKSWKYDSQESLKSLLKNKSENERTWFDEHYKSIKKIAKKYKAVIYFGDATGRQNEHLKDAKHIPPSVDGGVIMKSKKDFIVNEVSAISSKGHLQFSIIHGEINSKVIQTFLEQLKEDCKKKLFFITDSSYKTKRLDDWSRTNGEINVLFLPTDFQEQINDVNKDQDLRKRIKAAFPITKRRKKGNSKGESSEETHFDFSEFENNITQFK